jgi:hypothetical protein
MEGMDWIDLAEDRDRSRLIVKVVINIMVPQNVGNFLPNKETVSFSRKSVLYKESK